MFSATPIFAGSPVAPAATAAARALVTASSVPRSWPMYPCAVLTRLGIRSCPPRLLQHLLVLVLAHLLAPLLDYRAQYNSQAQLISRRGSTAANHTVSSRLNV